MPELPEVETIKNELQPMVGRRITGVKVVDPMAVERPSAAGFREGLLGRTISGLARRGKYLLLRLDDGSALVAHMRMTGSMLLAGPGRAGAPAGARTRVVFTLDDGRRLYFIDRRRLGRMWLVADATEVVGRLGPEPLSPQFTPEELGRILARRRAPVKAVLCDQEAVAGIGNMYADEALFEARIHPLAPADSLAPGQVARLHAAIKRVLESAIVNKGASVDTYFRPDGRKGSAHFDFRVAHRLGRPCPVCGGPVERIKVRGRGTYYCSTCQELQDGSTTGAT